MIADQPWHTRMAGEAFKLGWTDAGTPSADYRQRDRMWTLLKKTSGGQQPKRTPYNFVTNLYAIYLSAFEMRRNHDAFHA